LSTRTSRQTDAGQVLFEKSQRQQLLLSVASGRETLVGRQSTDAMAKKAVHQGQWQGSTGKSA
jgi:hypothetical protein